MYGFNETAERNALLDLIKESRKWILQVNRAILKAKENPEKAERDCLYVALQVLKACCINRYCVDFLGSRTSGVRRSFELLASSKVGYDIKEDEYICGWASDPNKNELLGGNFYTAHGRRKQKKQELLKSELPTEGQELLKSELPTDGQELLKSDLFTDSLKELDSLLKDSLPNELEGNKFEEYRNRYLMMMQIHPMYEVISFAAGIIRGVREQLMQFEEKKSNGRFWEPLTAWAGEENSKKAIELCRQVCRDALKRRTEGKRKEGQIEPFRHQGDPPNSLDVFDNQYSILSEMARADTTEKTADNGKMKVYSALLGKKLSRTMGKSFSAECALLAVYLWNRIGRMHAEVGLEEQENRSGIWVSIEGGKEGFGVYGDKRIAAAGFVDIVEKEQRSAGADRLMEFYRIGNIQEISLTPLANNIFTGKLHAMSCSALVAALIYRECNPLIGKDDPPLTSKWFKVEKGKEEQEIKESINFTDATIQISDWIWSAILCENKKGQNYLRLKDVGDSVSIALTRYSSRRFSMRGEMDNGKEDAVEALQACWPEIAPLLGYTTSEILKTEKVIEAGEINEEDMDFKQILSEIGETNQEGNDKVVDGSFLICYKSLILPKLEILLIDKIDVRPENIKLVDNDSADDDWLGTWGKLQRIIEWLDVTEMDDELNNPYMILMNSEEMIQPDELISKVDVLLWKFVQGNMPDDVQQYSEAVWRMADKAGAMIANILDGEHEAWGNLSSLKNVKKYGPAALGGDNTDGMKKLSSTWWMTRVMRSVLAFLYREDELTPSFMLDKREWELIDGPIDFDGMLLNEIKDTGNVEWIRNKIADTFLGITWEELDKQHKESLYEPKNEALEKGRKSFAEFCKERNSRQWRTEVLHAGNKYRIRVTERTLALSREANAWVKSCGEEDDSWMNDSAQMKCFEQYVRQQWLDVICDARRKKGEDNKNTLKLVQKKQRALETVLLAALKLIELKKLKKESVTTAVYPPSSEEKKKEKNYLDLKMEFRKGTKWTLSDVCRAPLRLKEEGNEKVYEEYKEELRARSFQATTKNFSGEEGRIHYRISRRTTIK